MKRIRLLLLAVMVAVVALLTRTQVSAFPCIPCMCVQNCETRQTSCINACKGNSACDQACGTAFSNCIDGCE
jgi:hypothetical protein